jgi:hypothetical protein
VNIDSNVPQSTRKNPSLCSVSKVSNGLIFLLYCAWEKPWKSQLLATAWSRFYGVVLSPLSISNVVVPMVPPYSSALNNRTYATSVLGLFYTTRYYTPFIPSIYHYAALVLTTKSPQFHSNRSFQRHAGSLPGCGAVDRPTDDMGSGWLPSHPPVATATFRSNLKSSLSIH